MGEGATMAAHCLSPEAALRMRDFDSAEAMVVPTHHARGIAAGAARPDAPSLSPSLSLSLSPSLCAHARALGGPCQQRVDAVRDQPNVKGRAHAAR